MESFHPLDDKLLATHSHCTRYNLPKYVLLCPLSWRRTPFAFAILEPISSIESGGLSSPPPLIHFLLTILRYYQAFYTSYSLPSPSHLCPSWPRSLLLASVGNRLKYQRIHVGKPLITSKLSYFFIILKDWPEGSARNATFLHSSGGSTSLFGDRHHSLTPTRLPSSNSLALEEESLART